jgi:hypothetical protein
VYETNKTFIGIVKQKGEVTDGENKRTNFHEMAHLYDFYGKKTNLSDQPWFKRAFDADKKEALTLWKSRKEYRAEIDSYEHFLRVPKEAFAEAVARVLLPPSTKADRDNVEKALFPNVMTVIKVKLGEDGIIAKQPRITMEQ